jgi:hypothetical protein
LGQRDSLQFDKMFLAIESSLSLVADMKQQVEAITGKAKGRDIDLASMKLYYEDQV